MLVLAGLALGGSIVCNPLVGIASIRNWGKRHFMFPRGNMMDRGPILFDESVAF